MTTTSDDFVDPLGWDGNLLDLDSYLTRIGYDGSREPTLTTLRQVARMHSQSIAFENLDILLERELLLDVNSLQTKMVTKHRGGYCYEQNMLLAAALERLGFHVQALSSRIMHTPDPDKLSAINHSALLVTIDQQRYVVDMGTGTGPEEPIELRDGATATTEHGWIYDLVKWDEFQWALRLWDGRQWVYLHTFS